MKLHRVATAGVISFLLFIPPLTVLAHDGSDDSSSSETTTQQETLKERIAEHKKEFAEHLSEVEHEHLMARCKFAQGIVEKHHHQLEMRGSKRTEAYGMLDKLLENIIPKLKNRGLDTTELEQERAALNEKAGKIKDDFTSYAQDLGDLKDMQCQSDPSGFKAALQAARKVHKAIVQDIVGLRTYVRETIIPTLKELRQQVKDSVKSQ